MLGERTLISPRLSSIGDDWSHFFSPGSRVAALPNWRSPRLLLPLGAPLQTWKYSSFYPAFRPLARLLRTMLRTRAASGFVESRTVEHSSGLLGDFLEGTVAQGTTPAVLLGTPGPAQKATLALWSIKDSGSVVAYLKFALKPIAQMRLIREAEMISALPTGIGPCFLKFGNLGEGKALLLAPLEGAPVPASLPPPLGLSAFLEKLKKRESYQIDHHPWVLEQRQAGDNLEGLLEPLSGRAWETVISHGDCAPWNLRACPRGLMAFDWEYGRLDGLPYLDLAYYLLQTAALIYRWSPSRAYDFAVRYLEKNEFALEIGEISAIVTLAAYTAYKQASLDGQPPDSRLQCWRSAIWRK